MAHVVVMPALGNSVESCLVNNWLVDEGDRVEPTTVLCEIETDKSTMEVPAGASGTVLKLLAGIGDEVAVKAPLAILGEPGEHIELDQVGVAPPDGAVAAASPRARSLAARAGLEQALPTSGTGPRGRVLERDVRAVLAATPRPTAATRGADRSLVDQPTGIGGRVSRSDLDVATADDRPRSGGAITTAAAPEDDYTDTSLQGIRKIIADRMTNALITSAQVSYAISAPADGLLALRRRFKDSDQKLGLSAVTLGDLVCFAAVQVLSAHPTLNAHLREGVLRTFRSVHLGLAVDTPRGLLVPTLRDAHTLSLRRLSAATKDLAQRARSGRIDPELLTGATFTVSNLGSFGIESFTPIVNVPQTGILGVGAITSIPTTADGSIGVMRRMSLSLTADHQVVDGADAARFLADLVGAITDIDLTIIGKE